MELKTYPWGASDSAAEVFSSLRKITVEPLMSPGLFYHLLAMFLDLDRVNSIAVYERVRQLSDFIKIS